MKEHFGQREESGRGGWRGRTHTQRNVKRGRGVFEGGKGNKEHNSYYYFVFSNINC